jgi:hypothetical protein
MLHVHPAIRWLKSCLLVALVLAGPVATAGATSIRTDARSGSAAPSLPTALSGMPVLDPAYVSLSAPPGVVRAPRWRGKTGRVTSTWTLRIAPETPAELLGEVFLVILGPDRNDPKKHKSKKAWLEMSASLPWRVLENETRPGTFYVAFALGALEPGGTYQIPVEYRLSKLKKKRGLYWFPRYQVAFATQPAVLPEPGSLALLAAGAAGLVLRLRPS